MKFHGKMKRKQREALSWFFLPMRDFEQEASDELNSMC